MWGEQMEKNLVPTDWTQDYFYYLQKNDNGRNILGNDVEKSNRLKEIKEKYQAKSAYLRKYSLYEGSQKVKPLIQKKVDECRRQEAAFLAGCLEDKNIDYGSITNKVRFWTNYFYYGIPTDKRINPSDKIMNLNERFCFKTIISSEEFTSTLRSKQGQTEMSREGFIQSFGKQMTVEEAEKQMMTQMKTFDAKAQNELQKSIINSFKSSVKDEFKGRVEADLNEMYNTIAKEYAEKGYEEIKKGFRNSTVNLFEQYAAEGLLTKKVVKSGQIKVTNGKEGARPVMTLSLRYKGAFEQIKEKEKDKNKNTSLIRIIVKSMIETVRLINHLDELDLMALGRVRISRKVKKSFYDKAKNYCSSPEVKNALENILQGKKSLDPISGVTGVIGELIGILNFKNVSDMIATGAINDKTTDFRGKTIDLGESFADIMTAYGGVNIKHYLSQKNILTLYEPKGDSKGRYNILGTAILRYIPLKQLAEMRFIDANYRYIKEWCQIDDSESDLEDTYEGVSILNLDNFIRQSSVVEDMKDVAFYQLNNLIVPSSEIYRALENVEFDYFKKLFDIQIDPLAYDTYTRPNERTNANHLLADYYVNKGSTIRFNGLKVNLNDLSKMLER